MSLGVVNGVIDSSADRCSVDGYFELRHGECSYYLPGERVESWWSMKSSSEVR